MDEMMLLDEAIEHAELLAVEKKRQEKVYEEMNDANLSNLIASCEECARKQEQIAKWLKELKAYKQAIGKWEGKNEDRVD